MSAPVGVRAVAAPVLARLADARTAPLSVSASAGYLDLDGFVAVLAEAGTPWLPNGIALTAAPPPADGTAEIAPGSLRVDGWAAAWDAERPPVWWPVVSAPASDPDALAARGEAILGALGVPALQPGTLASALGAEATAPGPEALGLLLHALATRDPRLARRAGRALTGRGPGLTPQGDDLLAGVAVTVAAAGGAAGLGLESRAVWLAALVPADVRARTTALAATLLELAVAGAAARPVHGLLDLACDDWRAELGRLEGLGASTGRATALGVGAAAALLGRAAARRVSPTAAPHLPA
jgi:hypothetical protein